MSTSAPIRTSSASEISAACAAAAEAFGTSGYASAPVRADFIDLVAGRIEALGESLIQTAMRESSLGQGRLEGERARTCGQLRMFASLIRTRGWMDIRIVEAEGRPDFRRTQVPLGPVAVFGASNFPLAFSVPGGDTASALAAGCPVVCKAHPSHPETSLMCGQAIEEAARELGLPAGVFSLVWGGAAEGQALASHPLVAAVAFTGSFRGGKALFDLAAARPKPIPVFAEMGSVNPVFLLPGCLEGKEEEMAKAYGDSLILGVGQFCTNPGVVAGLEGPSFELFLTALGARLLKEPPCPMLNSQIAESYAKGVAARSSHGALARLAVGVDSAPSLFAASARSFMSHPALQEELFGPTAVAVRCASEEEMLSLAESLEGQLTATIHFAESDLPLAARLAPRLARVAGRLVANGFPTGVDVNPAMQHGGPYPATTDSRFTSVGTAAIQRFVRPVCWQGFPTELLPEELQPAG